MRVDGKAFRSIWVAPDGVTVEIIDQTRLPHEFVTMPVPDLAAAAHAIKSMQVRGAPLIGAAAAYGMALAMRADPSDAAIGRAYDLLLSTRPTAINLRWALDDMRQCLKALAVSERSAASWRRATEICDEDVAINQGIGRHGLEIIRKLAARRDGSIDILTHCNAGWLATVDWGTALAPIYMAHDAGFKVHVWVDETRPRNQGASLTAWELGKHGVPYTVIVDNAGGHLMQHGKVDLCIVGTDRTTARGDVCNKIGTYLKALAAHDNGVPFYVGLPGPTIDWTISDGVRDIPIEERDAAEVTKMTGRTADNRLATVEITAPGARVANYGFDVTPARLVTGLITERGVASATEAGLRALYPDLQIPRGNTVAGD